MIYNYKLRAECSEDVFNFINASGGRIMLFKLIKDDSVIPDVKFEFETSMELSEVIKILRGIDDSHVMYQTVQLKENYTGVRNDL